MSIDTLLLGHLLTCTLLGLIGLLVPAVRGRNGLLIVGVVATSLTFRERTLGYFAAVAIVYACLKGIELLAGKSQRVSAIRWRLSVIFIFVIVTGFTALRIGGSESLLVEFSERQVVVLALDMWLVLRLVTFAWEVGAGRIRDPRLFDYLAWALNPFTLFGPVLRFSEYFRQAGSWPTVGGSAAVDRKLLSRTLALGLAQMAIGYGMSYMQHEITGVAHIPKVAAQLLTFFLLAPWSFYLVIAGYLKVMEACAPQWGLVLAPSFDRAFVQKNLADFWSRWNMTATAVFRDYAYYVKWGLSRPNVYLNTMVVFVLVGLWHSANGYWILWGAMHGVGFCIYLLFRKHGGPLRDLVRWLPLRFRNGLAWATTYVFVCSCWAAPPWLIQRATGYLDTLWRMAS